MSQTQHLVHSGRLRCRILKNLMEQGGGHAQSIPLPTGLCQGRPAARLQVPERHCQSAAIHQTTPAMTDHGRITAAVQTAARTGSG